MYTLAVSILLCCLYEMYAYYMFSVQIGKMSPNGTTELQKIKSVASLSNCAMICVIDKLCCSADFNEVSKECIIDSGCDTTLKYDSNVYHLNLRQVSCDLGWIEHERKCYLFSDESVDWYTAKDTCQNVFGGKLAEPENQLEIRYLRSKAMEEQGIFWLGASNLNSEGEWKWVSDGRTITEFDWAYTVKYGFEPSNGKGGTENCIQILHGIYKYRWNDNNCMANVRYICEKSP